MMQISFPCHICFRDIDRSRFSRWRFVTRIDCLLDSSFCCLCLCLRALFCSLGFNNDRRGKVSRIDIVLIQNTSVVSMTVFAAMELKMETSNRLRLAIIAKHARHAVLVSIGHSIYGYSLIQLAIPCVHVTFVRDTLAAYRTNIASSHMFFQATHMHWMRTDQEDGLICTGRQIIPTYGTVRVQISLPTWMSVFRLQRHASRTLIAMMIINAKPFTDPTYTAIITMVRVRCRRIIVQSTGVTEVARKLDAARATVLGDRLFSITARNTRDNLCRSSIYFMIFRFVVTTTTWVIPPATSSLDPAISRIMLAPTRSGRTWKDTANLHGSPLHSGCQFALSGEERVDLRALFVRRCC